MPLQVWAADLCPSQPALPSYDYNVQGNDGWVFDAREDLLTSFSISAENLSLLRQFSQLLKRNGTHLLIAYLPLRSMTVPQLVDMDNSLIKSREYNPAGAHKAYLSLISEMNTTGIDIVGVDELKPDFFNRQESHWSDNGAAAMARVVADYIFKKEWLRRATPTIEPSLLDKANATDITLVGTSFSDNKSYEDTLAQLLNNPNIWNGAIQGGGLDYALARYLGSRTYRETKPAVLIWEIPGYYSFDDVGMTIALRRAIGAVLGNCDNVQPRMLQTNGSPINLTNFNGQAYVAMHLPWPIAVGHLQLKWAQTCLSIEKPFIPQHEVNFYYLLPDGAEEGAQLSVAALPPDAVAEVRLCPVN